MTQVAHLGGRQKAIFELSDDTSHFAMGNRPHLYSLVLALVVPTATEAELFYQFLRLRDSWPQRAVEIKGSKLNEGQTAQVAELLAVHDVIAEYYAIRIKRIFVDITAELSIDHIRRSETR